MLLCCIFLHFWPPIIPRFERHSSASICTPAAMYFLLMLQCTITNVNSASHIVNCRWNTGKPRYLTNMCTATYVQPLSWSTIVFIGLKEPLGRLIWYHLALHMADHLCVLLINMLVYYQGLIVALRHHRNIISHWNSNWYKGNKPVYLRKVYIQINDYMQSCMAGALAASTHHTTISLIATKPAYLFLW